MTDPSSYVRDPDRLDAVRRTRLLDTPPEEVFDRLTRLAARITGVPVAFISLVDENRDFYKSCVGFGEPLATTREISGPTFCHYALPLEEPLVIPDTRADPAYRQVPTVETLGVAAYLGIPLRTSGDQTIGSFCAVDFEPREWKEMDVEVLSELAASAMREIELRQEIAERMRAEAERERLLEREQRARAEAERRAREEEALRYAAHAVTASFTVDETSQRIAECALEAVGANGAFVERIDLERGEVVVIATAGERVPPMGARVPYSGSFTEHVVKHREPAVVEEMTPDRRPLPSDLAQVCASCSAMVVPLTDGGEPIGSLIVLRDPGAEPFRPDEAARAQTFADLAALAFRRIHLLEDSERRREELEQVTESRARLMRGFSHDLKNPLGAADGHAQLLEDEVLGPLDPGQRRSVGRIRALIRSALDLIDDLVELARAEAGQVEIDRAPTDVREVVWELAEEYRAQAEAVEIAMETEIPEEFPLVQSDPSRIRQVLGNLISNAVKYNRAGGRVRVRVELRSRGGPEPGKCVAVDVADTGPGIPEEKRHLLFREFSRLDPGATGGAGLGLAISQRIAQALGGEIALESEVGRGSTFTLWIPLARAENGAGKSGGEEGAAPRAETSPGIAP